MWRWILSKVVSLYRQVMDATKELFIRILMGVLIFLGYVLLSLFIYAVMRRIMVPQKTHIIPVHLQYSSNCLGRGLGEDVAKCAFPQADILLNNGKKLFRSGQYYRIALDIEMPEKQVNLDAGAFMVNLTFYSTQQRFLSTSARPTALRYRSFLLRTVSTLVFALPLVFGLWEQMQVLELVLFDDYCEPYGDGALSAKLFLESHQVHVYSTVLSVDANFSGFTYYLYQWPISMTVIVVISILVTLCTCTVLIWLRDVINDFEERRAIRMQRRRGLQQRGRGRAEHRTMEQRRQQQAGAAEAVDGRGRREAETLRARGESSGAVSVETVDTCESTTPTNTRESITPTDTHENLTPTDTRESSVGRESEISGLGDMLSNLQSLRRELESDDSAVSTDTPLSGEDVGRGERHDTRTSETGELRRRTCN